MPMRIKEKWVLVTCDIAKRKYDWVLFNQWAHYQTVFMVTYEAQRMQKAALKSRLKQTGRDCRR